MKTAPRRAPNGRFLSKAQIAALALVAPVAVEASLPEWTVFAVGLERVEGCPVLTREVGRAVVRQGRPAVGRLGRATSREACVWGLGLVLIPVLVGVLERVL